LQTARVEQSEKAVAHRWITLGSIFKQTTKKHKFATTKKKHVVYDAYLYLTASE